jgi:hypothetical protein
MKQLRIAALAAMLTVGVSGTTLADTDFGALRHDPMAAIEAGDQLGLQTIPRTELEEVRGEGFGNDVVGTIIAIAMSSNISKTQLLRSICCPANIWLGMVSLYCRRQSFWLGNWESSSLKGWKSRPGPFLFEVKYYQIGTLVRKSRQ